MANFLKDFGINLESKSVWVSEKIGYDQSSIASRGVTMTA